ncbi:hypothetical protein U14_04030 [Candidatus Moduliflexus flocculans]|uniref:Uncharacterized protein n=1 Tax=Candidatus Moduliflexus flocculans TaxID=1499966 RepID=A0A0S6VZR0_9BACT|nr:hypothetical protein U14_04030 [Candidatus Moduliflexus flocculans]
MLQKRLELRFHLVGLKFPGMAMRQHEEQRRTERIVIRRRDSLPAELLEGNVAIRADDRCSGQHGRADALLHRAEIHEIDIIHRRSDMQIRRNDDIFRVHIAVNHRRTQRMQIDQNVEQINENVEHIGFRATPTLFDKLFQRFAFDIFLHEQKLRAAVGIYRAIF